MSNNQFVHLHVHTEFSLLDGQSRINKLVDRAQELEMPALGITDHGVMFGVIDFYRACTKAGVKPIIGVEAYLAPRSMEDRDPVLDKSANHLLLLAKNQTGYQNLLKLSSEAQLRGYYYRPRVDRALVAEYAEGLICTSGCLAAEIPRLVMDGREDDAREKIGWYQEVFGAEHFFLEVQQHDIPELKTVNKWLVEYSKSGHAPVGLLATNDVHYVLKDDADAQDTLLCVQTGALKTAPNRMRMSDPSYHLATQDEMWRFFGEIPDALYNSVKIAEMCDVNLDSEGYHLPVFPVPDGHNDTSYLRLLCEKGMDYRYDNWQNDAVLTQRLDYELSIIDQMGFNTYFLIVWDLCEYARHHDIWWNVRGSGAGSLVAYSLGITNIDPIQNDLLFERFLNPSRVSMPDIDLDYPDDRRGEMIAYAARKYGEDKVAAIITFGTLGAKNAVRDVGRVMDVDLSTVNKAAGLIPQEAKQKPIREYIDGNSELKALYTNDPVLKTVLDTAMELQGISRHASTHAAGVIIADAPLTEYLPLHRITGKDPSGGALKAVTQFPMETCESIGLLKVDFLGLSTLTIMRKAAELIEKYHGIRYSMSNIPYRHDDPRLNDEQIQMLDETFKLLGRGETVGVFQVESGGMQQMLRGMRPFKFEHIVAGVSLYRPGPMEFIPQYNRRLHGKEEPEYRHPALVPILEETFGIIVYQEQILQIASRLFGYEPGEADLMRKAVSKKREKDLLKHKAIFLERGPEYGVDVESAERIFAEIEFFANYGFNKAHASDYAVITVQTAFLKTHYPEEYMTALLTVQKNDSVKVATFLEECRRMNIPVLPPDINYSAVDFDIEQLENGQRAIRFGLGGIKNAGISTLEYTIQQRQAEGPFVNLDDFCHRVDMRIVGKRTLESLIKVGALDDYGNRQGLLESIERISNYSARHHKDKEVGQLNLFGELSDSAMNTITIPDVEEPPMREYLRWEKDLLGLYITGRPVDKYRAQLEKANLHMIQEIKDPEHFLRDQTVQIAGEIVELRRLTTRNGDSMAVLQIEDWHDTAATIEVVLFPRTYRQVVSQFEELGDERTLIEGEIILVKGKLDHSRGDPQIICDEVSLDFDVFHAEGELPIIDNGVPKWVEENEFAPPPLVESNQAYESELPSSNGITEDFSPPDPVDTIPSENGHVEHDPTIPAWVAPGEEKVSIESVDVLEPDEQRYAIEIYFQRTGHNDRDRRRLKMIYNNLVEYPGGDQFSVLLISDQGQKVLEFPGQTTDCCEALILKLEKIVGKGNVKTFLIS